MSGFMSQFCSARFGSRYKKLVAIKVKTESCFKNDKCDGKSLR